MDEIARNAPPESPAAETGRWMGRLLIAVILGEGIWGLIVSLTRDLILPLLAKIMGGDVQSPLYLGKGEVNVPALFTSVLELCFAGILAVILNAWVQRRDRSTRSKPIRIAARGTQSAASIPPTAVTPVKPTAVSPPVITAVPATAVHVPAVQFRLRRHYRSHRRNSSGHLLNQLLSQRLLLLHLRSLRPSRRSRSRPKRFITTSWASQLIRPKTNSLILVKHGEAPVLH